MRQKSRVVNITGMTLAQIQTALDTALNTGWELIQIVVISANVYAILIKKIAE